MGSGAVELTPARQPVRWKPSPRAGRHGVKIRLLIRDTGYAEFLISENSRIPTSVLGRALAMDQPIKKKFGD